MRIQVVYSAPRRIKTKKKRLTKKGERLMLHPGLTTKQKKEIWAKYGKPIYRKNPDAVPVKQIKHY